MDCQPPAFKLGRAGTKIGSLELSLLLQQWLEEHGHVLRCVLFDTLEFQLIRQRRLEDGHVIPLRLSQALLVPRQCLLLSISILFPPPEAHEKRGRGN